MPETIFEMTLDGTLTYVNRNAYNYFGYTRTDVKNGLNSLDVLIPEDSERAAANMAKIVAGE
jgi:PAS domain S-box-containing protein